MNTKLTACALDIETYYAQDYSLGGMSTWEYISDPRFRIEGVALRAVDMHTGRALAPASSWTPLRLGSAAAERESLREWLLDLGYTTSSFAVAHNGAFDFTSIGWYTGLVPQRMMCTQLMALYIMGSPDMIGGFKNLPGGTNSLASLSEYFGRAKDTGALHDTKGMHIENFTPDQLTRWMAYMHSDVDNMVELLLEWWNKIPSIQRYAINWSLKQMAFPVLQFDADKADIELAYTKEVREVRLAQYGVTAEVFRSADKFKTLVQDTGYPNWPDVVTPKGNVKPLMSKAHPLWKKIRTSPDTPQHTKDFMDLRDEVTSASRDKRIPRYSTISRRLSGAFPVHVMPSGAHTHRLTGGSGSGGNPLNMPSDGLIRRCVKAPKGFKLAVFDFTGKELRVARWVAHDKPAKQMILDGIDMYTQFVAVLHSKPVEYVTAEERKKIGKLAHLSCQYGTGKDRASEALECTVEEADAIVKSFRYVQHPALPAAWKVCDQLLRLWCAPEAAWSNTYSEYVHNQLNLPGIVGYQKITWPSGRVLPYPEMHVQSGASEISKGGEIAYRRRGPGQEPKKIYGALLFENCIAYDTPVLTDSGILPIQRVTNEMRVWDGYEWVSHDGLVCRGEQEVMNCHGVLMTADHEVLTDDGWKEAHEAGNYRRWEVPIPDGLRVGERTPDIQMLVRDGGSLPEPRTRGVQELRRARYSCLRFLAELRELCFRHGRHVVLHGHGTLQSVARGTGREVIQTAGTRRQVFDLLNAGPRHRFTVLDERGELLTVSNCIQSLANEIMWEKQYRIENELGIRVAMQVYDEIVCIVHESVIEQQMPRIKAILEEPPTWWPDCPPLEADGGVADDYASAK